MSGDKSLLERLNALKPSSVSLISPPPSKSNPASTIERAKTPSREDALTARLRSLRSQGSESIDSTATDQHHGIGEPTQAHPTRETEPFARGTLGIRRVHSPLQVTDDVDPLLYTDDQTLEELLEDLRSDDTWLDEVAAEEEENQKVAALFTELKKPSPAEAQPDKQNSSRDISQEDRESSEDDDSEGDAMATEVDYVLAKAIDELEWEKVDRTPSPSPQPKASSPENAQQTAQNRAIHAPGDEPFSLPTVPSNLQDQLGSSTQAQSDVDFAASIASRMAALKLSGPRALPSAPTAAVDSLSLPQAPTFKPADRPVPGVAKRTGLTDDDQKTWCVVCLEDGAVRCLGCDAGDDVYCARCWKEMHIGPQAGYDERGHPWETFVSRPR
ncbi:hypothetical protein F5B18DRAFT_651933 [Nemania serpens]|nr:hypothetical protein F5B18DRAFT_651933 [Nemania serpens]